ncbi:MAG: tRNA pseudouridine(38-40) synthase TruA [Candidatus Sericytochromatia bacterium]
MQRTLALHLAYQGAHFAGYQVQPQKRTVQSELLTALARFLPDAQRLICAGRTDAGVHAYAQLVQLDTHSSFPLAKLPDALNSQLPEDLRVIQAWEVPAHFSARFDAQARHYRYLIQLRSGPVYPHQRGLAWQCHFPMDTELLKRVWREVQGRHDFAAFCKSGSYREHKTVIDLRWSHCWQYGDWLVLELMAQSFLYNMVRTLVGTAVDIARGQLPPERMREALAQRDRRLVGHTAPPQGLYLFNVVYPPAFGLDLVRENLQGWPVPLADPQIWQALRPV